MEMIELNTKSTTYQIGIHEKGFLFHLYYGPRTKGSMSPLLTYYPRGGNGVPFDCAEQGLTFSCDALPQEYSCCGSGDYRRHAFIVRTENGCSGADLRYKSHRFLEGKYSIPSLPASYGEDGVKTCEIVLEDSLVGVQVILRYGLFYEEDVITRAVEVKNLGAQRLYLNKVMSASMDFLTGDYELIHFFGRHFHEMGIEKTTVGHSCISIGSRRGVTGHQHNSFAILAETGADEDHGACYGFSLMYSGNFLLEAEQDQYNQVRIQTGLSDERLDYLLDIQESFFTPEVILAFSADGFARLSHIYHSFIRNHVCRGPYKLKRRPILINNWEATYFDFTADKLLEIASEAAALGIEMFVLDDGWFGHRGPDDRGLGDWYVNKEKMGGELSEIVDKIHSLGMKFGLWIEPEMVNRNSDLYRAHPDWALQIPGKPPVLGRNQLVLDFTRKDIRDAIFEQIAAVIDSAEIEYIKMDMNRSICEVYSARSEWQNFGEFCYKYVLGVYDFLSRLQKRYPDMLIEGCSSGGARFDAGMMYYTPQIWLSDNTDAIERLRIQYGASFGYPVSVVGSHVSTVPNHQNGRITGIDTRAAVAMAGNFGYELDLTKLSAADKEKIKQQITAYCADWEIIHNGRYYRVTDQSQNNPCAVWNMVSADQGQALLQIVTINSTGTPFGNPIVYYARCKGLDAAGTYLCRENGLCYSGSELMFLGIPVPAAEEEYMAFRFHLDRQSGE